METMSHVDAGSRKEPDGTFTALIRATSSLGSEETFEKKGYATEAEAIAAAKAGMKEFVESVGVEHTTHSIN